MIAQAAGIVAAALLALVAALQLALALGAPLAHYAWGGAYEGVLPPRMRIGSAVSAPLLLGMAAIVLIAAGVLLPALRPAMLWPAWLVFLFMVVNTFANLRSRSRSERRLMTPVTATVALLLLVIQFSG